MSIIEKLVWHRDGSSGRIRLARSVDDSNSRRHPAGSGEPVHFCEHDGIRIRFTRAMATWHAHTPSAIRPWWFTLPVLRSGSAGEASSDRDSDQSSGRNNDKRSSLHT